MGLQKEILLQEQISVPNAYHKIEATSLAYRNNIKRLNISVGVYKDKITRDENKPTIQDLSFPTDDSVLIDKLDTTNSEGFRIELYNYLKTLSEYENAITI